MTYCDFHSVFLVLHSHAHMEKGQDFKYFYKKILFKSFCATYLISDTAMYNCINGLSEPNIEVANASVRVNSNSTKSSLKKRSSKSVQNNANPPDSTESIYTFYKSNPDAFQGDIAAGFPPSIDRHDLIDILFYLISDDCIWTDFQKAKMRTTLCPNPSKIDDSSFIAHLSSFILEILIRPFIKRTDHFNQLIQRGTVSPLGFGSDILNPRIPRPTSWFVGRVKELESLKDIMFNKSYRPVFISGLPGIGKSEFVRKYVQYVDYKNVIYIKYHNSPGGSERKSEKKRMTIRDCILSIHHRKESEFKDAKNSRPYFNFLNQYLQSLGEESLLIIDDYNQIDWQEPELSNLYDYGCHVIITTRCTLNEKSLSYHTFLLDGLKTEDSISLLTGFNNGSSISQVDAVKLIWAVHNHTYSVELIGRLLCFDNYDPKDILKMIRSHKADPNMKVRKFGKNDRKAKTYTEYIRILFRLFETRITHQDHLRNLSLFPPEGIPMDTYVRWLHINSTKELQHMVNLGLIQLEENGIDSSLTLQPMMRDAIYIDDDTRPSVSSCKLLLTVISSLCNVLGRCEENFHILSRTIYSIIENIDTNVPEVFNQFLLDVWSYLNIYEDKYIMQCLTSDIERMILESGDDNAEHKARLSILKCEFIEDNQVKITMHLAAINSLQTVTPNNAGFLATTYSNLGAFYTKAKDLKKAEHAFQKSYSLFTEYGLANTDGFGDLLFNKSAFLLSINHTKEALDCLKLFAACCPEIGTLHNAEAHALLALNYRRLGEYLDGKNHLITAIQSYSLFYRDVPNKMLSQLLSKEREQYVALLGAPAVDIPLLEATD